MNSYRYITRETQHQRAQIVESEEDADTFFKPAIDCIEAEIAKTYRVFTTPFPSIQLQRKQVDENDIMFAKQKRLQELLNAITALRNAVKTDDKLPLDEAKRIADSTYELVDAVVKPNITYQELQKAADNFRDATSPLNVKYAALAILCLVVFFIAVPMALPIPFGLAAMGVISVNLCAFLSFGSLFVSMGSVCAGLSFNQRSRSRFFDQRKGVEAAVDEFRDYNDKPYVFN